MQYNSAFSGFSADDIPATKQFYQAVLGLAPVDSMGGFQLSLSGGQEVFVYPKSNHQPASFTVLNFVVQDLDIAVAELKAKGVTFEHYDGVNPDEDIARGKAQNMGPDIAWFKDPAGNVLALIAE